MFVSRWLATAIHVTCLLTCVASSAQVAQIDYTAENGAVSGVRAGNSLEEIRIAFGASADVDERELADGRQEVQVSRSGTIILNAEIGADGNISQIVAWNNVYTKDQIGPGSTLGDVIAEYGLGRIVLTDRGPIIHYPDREELDQTGFLIKGTAVPAEYRVSDDTMTDESEIKLQSLGDLPIVAIVIGWF